MVGPYIGLIFHVKFISQLHRASDSDIAFSSGFIFGIFSGLEFEGFSKESYPRSTQILVTLSNSVKSTQVRCASTSLSSLFYFCAFFFFFSLIFQLLLSE